MSRAVAATPRATPPLSTPAIPTVCSRVFTVSKGVVNIAAVDPAMPPTASEGRVPAPRPAALAYTARISFSNTKNLMADCGMFRHNTAVHPLYSPPTPLSRTIILAACHALTLPLTWHLCLTHSEGVYTNEVATLAAAPAAQCATHWRSSENKGASLSLAASYDAVYSAEMGAADARDADNPLYSPNGPRCLSMVATTAPTDRLERRSAWIATFTVSTGCSTRLTSVPATAPATAFTLTAARPLTPGVPEPRSPRPSLGRVVVRVATRARSMTRYGCLFPGVRSPGARKFEIKRTWCRL